MFRNLFSSIIAALFAIQTYANTGALAAPIPDAELPVVKLSNTKSLLQEVANQSADLSSTATAIDNYAASISTFSNFTLSMVGVDGSTGSIIDLLTNSKNKLEVGIENFHNNNKKDAEIIYNLTKQTFTSTDKVKMSYIQVLVYSALLAQRDSYKQMVASLVPLAILSGNENLHQRVVTSYGEPTNVFTSELDPEVLNFRRIVIHEYLTCLSMLKLIEGDIFSVTQTLKELKNQNVIDPKLNDLLMQSLSTVSVQAKEERDIFKNNMKKDYQVPEAIRQIMSEVKGHSLLYSPDQDASIVSNIISWVGNLTWGLVNTIIGAGIVLVSMVAVPIASLFIEGRIRFPTFSISSSGSQLYVYTPYLGLMSGKMSMGLFEFDNTGSYRWASEHEGVHALQSAVLGPFYLPTILVTYLMFGFDQGPLEDMADHYAGRV